MCTGDFTKKLVLIGSLKNCDFWCVDISMNYLSNAFWITLIWDLWDYGYFARTAQIKLKLCTSVFYPMQGNYKVSWVQKVWLVYGSLFGLKNRVKWAWKWNLRSGQSNDSNQCLLDSVGVIWAFMNLTTPLQTLNLVLFISEALHFLLSISEISETHISFISIKIFSLSAQSFWFGLFCFSLLHFKFNNPNWLIFQIILL